MNYYEEIKKTGEYESDATYLAYETFILKGIPFLIKKAIKNNDSQIDFGFNFFAIHEGLNGDEAEISLLEVKESRETVSDFGSYYVNINQFLSYVIQIPGITIYENTLDNGYDGEGYVDYYIKTIDLVNYYYEELQRMEYQTGMSR